MEGSSKRNTMVTGMFRDRDSAERAYQSTTARGYAGEDINLAMSRRAYETLRIRHQGGIVMGVTPRSDEDAEYFEREWKNSRGAHVYR